MSHNPIEVHIEPPNKSTLPNDTFLRWLKKQYFLLISQIAVFASLLYGLVSFIYYLRHGEYHEYLEPRKIQDIIYFTHLFILILFILWLIGIINVNRKNYQKAKFTFQRVFGREIDDVQAEHGEKKLFEFKKWFLRFWIGMLLLYGSFVLQGVLQNGYEPVQKREIFKIIESLGGGPEGSGESENLQEEIRKLEILVENSPDVRALYKEVEILSKFKSLKDKDLKERIDESVKVIERARKSTVILGNPEIEKKVRESYDSTDPELRRTYLEEAQNAIYRLPTDNLSAEEKDFFDNIKKIKTTALNYSVNYKELKKEVKALLKSKEESEKIDIAPVQWQIDQTIKAAYRTDNPAERESLLKYANDLIYKQNYFWDTFKRIIFTFVTYSLNNLGSWIIFVCFIIASTPGPDENSTKQAERKFHFSVFILAVLILTFPVVMAMEVFSGISGTNLINTIVVFDAVSGILNAVTLALLIARFDNKLIGLPSYLISILYFYAAVQPLFVAFELPGEISQIIKTCVLIVVFISKIYFFLIITFVLQTGRMLTYLYCYPTLNKRVDSIFANPFLIRGEEKADHFKFHIEKASEQLFSGELQSGDEMAFFRKIDELREATKKEEQILITEISPGSGKFKVEIIGTDPKEILCRSVNLTLTEDEANKLKTESKDNIPYCDVQYTDQGEHVQLLLSGTKIEKSYKEVTSSTNKPESDAGKDVVQIVPPKPRTRRSKK